MKRIVEGLLFLSILLIYACSDPTDIGESLLPGDNLFNTEDTVLEIKLKTVREDSIRTDSIGRYLLGYIKDEPDFGSTKANIFTQVRLQSNNNTFSDGVIYDSLVLHLDYNFSYGDTTANQTIKIYELTKALSSAEEYNMYYEYNNGNLPVGIKEQPVGMLENYRHNFSDSIKVRRPLLIGEDTVNYAEAMLEPQLSIRLSDELGQLFYDQILLNDDEENSDNPFDNNDLFLEFFKGFFITVTESGSDDNLMVSYNLGNSTTSRLSLYHHTETQNYIYGDTINGVVDSTLVTNYSYLNQPLNFPTFNNTNTDGIVKSVNQIINDYSDTKANDAINNGMSEIAYAIGMGGLNIEVEIEDIDASFFEDFALHKATLQLEEAESNNFDRYFVPPIFFVSSIDENGGFSPIDDYTLQFQSENFYEAGGFAQKEDSLSRNTYSINCTTFMQNYIEGEITGPLILTPSASWLNIISSQFFTVPLNSRYFIPSRVKLSNGGANSNTKLVLKYSKINN